MAAEENAHKTLACRVRTYFFGRLPFVLMIAPATFQRLLIILLAEHRWKIFLDYFHDIIMFTKDLNTHIKNTTKVPALKGAGVSLELEKRRPLKQNFGCLGCIVRLGELIFELKRTEKLAEATLPTTRTHLSPTMYGRCLPTTRKRLRQDWWPPCAAF